jgi:hypothetical protein
MPNGKPQAISRLAYRTSIARGPEHDAGAPGAKPEDTSVHQPPQNTN